MRETRRKRERGGREEERNEGGVERGRERLGGGMETEMHRFFLLCNITMHDNIIQT